MTTVNVSSATDTSAAVGLGESGGCGDRVPKSTALETPTQRRGRKRPAWVSLAIRAALPVVFLAAWWISTSSGAVDRQVLASPGEVASALRELAENGQLVSFTLASLYRAAVGVFFGATVGLVLGVVAGLYALGEEVVDSTMQIVRAVPFLALVPLFIAWFGIGDLFKVMLIAIATVAPMYAYSYLGVRNVDRKMIEAAQGFGLKGYRLVFGVIIPSALPGILMALRICLAISITGLIAAEQVGTRQGIGYLVTLAQEYSRVDYMILCVVLYAALGLIFDVVVRLLERYAMPWQAGVRHR